MRETHAAAPFPFPQRLFLFRLPMTGEVVLGFDFGTRRIGLALGNSITRQARPLRVIDSEQTAARWAAIAQAVQEWQPARFIVGLPRHPDGAEHEMTQRAQRFGRQLAGRYGLPVAFVDERYSSVVLEAGHDNDAEAAAVILQQWFEEQGHGLAGPHKENN